MPRYIDADALIENTKRVYCADCNSYNGVRCKACGTGDALDMIEDAPAADVVPRSIIADIFADISRLLAINYCSSLQNCDCYFEGDLAVDIDELEEKYTEEKDGTGKG